MKGDAERDQVEVIRACDGRLFAKASVGEQTFTHDLPIGFETWPADQQQAHMRRFIAPWLKTKVNAVRPTTAVASEDTPVQAKVLTLQDDRRLTLALAKRERRRLKLVN